MPAIELYEHSVRKLFPDLYYALMLVDRLKDHNVFPIVSIDELVDALLADDLDKKAIAVLKFENVSLSAEGAADLFPLLYFPIRDADELVEKLYAAFAGFREMRSLEAKVQSYRRSLHTKRGGAHV
jgi:hypothetical protein